MQAEVNKDKDEIRSTLKELTQLLSSLPEWLEGQYDPDTGGFYYARSSKNSGQFSPDIESSAQAVNMIERLGELPAWPASLKEKALRFFQGKQDASSGYFYDENPNMRLDEVMTGRAIGYSLNAIRRLGGEPLYPLPAVQSTAPEYMCSPEAYSAWLRNIPLTNSWRGCDRLCNAAPYISQLGAAEKEAYLREAWAFFDEIQDPETGLWGEGSLYVRISGTFKLHTFYNHFAQQMPRTKEMYRSILHCLQTEQAVDMCYIRNPIHLLSSMKADIPPAEMRIIAEITTRNMTALKRADGGFSRELAHSPTAPNVAQVKPGEYYPDMPQPVHLGLGLVEGDMNAGTQALLIHSLLHELAGLPRMDVPVPDQWFACYETRK